MAAIALDTNILAYCEGVRRVAADDTKMETARTLILDLEASDNEICIPAQVLAELHHVLRRKMRLEPEKAGLRAIFYADQNLVIATDSLVLEEAFEIVSMHDLQTYDAIILAAAAQAGCDTLYSEDMQHGFVWRGVEVVNPFL